MLHHATTKIRILSLTIASLALTLMLTSRSESAIVFSGQLNIQIPSNSTGLYLNVVTGEFSTTEPIPNWTINPWGSFGVLTFSTPIGLNSPRTQHLVRTGGGAVANLQGCDLSGPIAHYGGWSRAQLNASFSGNQPFIPNGLSNVYAFRFLLNGNPHYGVAYLSIGQSFSERTLMYYLWNDEPNKPVPACLGPQSIRACCFDNGTCALTYEFSCLQLGGQWHITSMECAPGLCTPVSDCPIDFVPPGGDGVVGVPELLAVIGGWAWCPSPPAACAGDVDGNKFVSVPDLLAVISHWGACR